MIYSLFFIIFNTYQYKASGKKYEDIKSIYEDPHHDSSTNIKNLKHINSEYIGWIQVEGTEISYPVVLGDDNDYYLNHNFHKEPDKVGAIFMDHRNSGDQLDDNTIIYGHNMKDKSMFAGLSSLLEQDFYNQNKHIYFDFNGSRETWEIFSAYVTRDASWMETSFNTKGDLQNYIDDKKGKSAVSMTDGFDEADHILTLATCTTVVSDERVVVHARLVKEQQ